MNDFCKVCFDHGCDECAPIETSKNSYCEICSNAYGTRYVCASCRKDPANDGWLRARPDTPHVLDALTSPQEAVIAALFAVRCGESDKTQREIAADCGVGLSFVKKIHANLLLVKFYQFKSVRDREAAKSTKRYPISWHILEGDVAPHSQLVGAAWREWRDVKAAGCLWDQTVAHLCRLQDGEPPPADATERAATYPLDHVDPPRRFVAEELGYGVEQQPTLDETCRCLQHMNTWTLERLGEPTYRVTYPLNFVYPDPQETPDSDE